MKPRRRSSSQGMLNAVTTAAKVWTGAKAAKGVGRAGKTGLKAKGARKALSTRGGRKAAKYGLAAKAAGTKTGRRSAGALASTMAAKRGGGGRKRLVLLGLGGAAVALVVRKRSTKGQDTYDWTTAAPPVGAGAGAPAAAADPSTTDPGGVSGVTAVGTTDLDTPTHAADGLGIDAPNHGATGLTPEAVDEQARDS